jgi:hypothetical protein
MPDEGYSRNASYEIKLISTFLFSSIVLILDLYKTFGNVIRTRQIKLLPAVSLEDYIHVSEYFLYL